MHAMHRFSFTWHIGRTVQSPYKEPGRVHELPLALNVISHTHPQHARMLYLPHAQK